MYTGHFRYETGARDRPALPDAHMAAVAGVYRRGIRTTEKEHLDDAAFRGGQKERRQAI